MMFFYTYLLLFLMILIPLLTIVNCSLFIISYNDEKALNRRDPHKFGVVCFTLAIATISLLLSTYFIILQIFTEKKIGDILFGFTFLFYFITILFSFISSALYQTDFADHYRFNLGLTIFIYILCVFSVVMAWFLSHNFELGIN